MLEAMVFDFDGVLVDTEPLHYRAFADTVGPLGVAFGYEQYRARYIGFDDRDGFRAICAEHHIPIDDAMLAGLIERKATRFGEIVGQGVATMPGAMELLGAAFDALPVALCSGALRHDIDLILPRLGGDGIRERFRAIVTADDVRRSKPDPEGYRLASQRLGVAPSRCLAVEDTPAGIASAKSAGMRVLAVTTSFATDQLSEADRIVDSLASVSIGELRRWMDKGASPRRR